MRITEMTVEATEREMMELLNVIATSVREEHKNQYASVLAELSFKQAKRGERKVFYKIRGAEEAVKIEHCAIDMGYKNVSTFYNGYGWYSISFEF